MKSAPYHSADSDNEPARVVINVTPLVRFTIALLLTRYIGGLLFIAFCLTIQPTVGDHNILASHRMLTEVVQGYLFWAFAVGFFYTMDNALRPIYFACGLVNLLLVLPWLYRVQPGALFVSKGELELFVWMASATMGLFLSDAGISYLYGWRAKEIAKLEGYYCPPATGPRDLPVRWGWRSIMFAGLGLLLLAPIAINVLSGFTFYPAGLKSLIDRSLLLLAAACFFEARRWRVLPADAVLKKDPRPPVLILRSFGFDNQLSHVALGGENVFERTLSSELSTVGPLIALHNQKMRRPFHGIATELVDNNNWKEKFLVYLDKAGLIVLLAGESASFRWELDQVIDRGLLSRTLLVFPPYAKYIVVANVIKSIPHYSRLELNKDRKPGSIILLIRWSIKNDPVVFKAASLNANLACRLALRHSVTLSAQLPSRRKTKKARFLGMVLCLASLGAVVALNMDIFWQYLFVLDEIPPVQVMPLESISALSVDDLLKAFKEDEVSANKTFVGKTVLIRGLIGELVKDKSERVREDAGAWYGATPRDFKKVLLVSEKSVDGRPKELLPLDRYYRDSFINDYYAKLQFEGIYCKFDQGFQLFHKEELLLKCKIRGFESGVITSEDGYMNKDYPPNYVGQEKKRVIAVNCSERGFLLRQE